MRQARSFPPAAAAAPGCRRGCARRSTGGCASRAVRCRSVLRACAAAHRGCRSCRCRAAPRRAAAGRRLRRSSRSPRRAATTTTRRAGCDRWCLRRDTRRRAPGARSSRCASIRARATGRWRIRAASGAASTDPGRASGFEEVAHAQQHLDRVERLGDEILGAARQRLLARVDERSPVTTSTGSRSWLMSGVSKSSTPKPSTLRHVQIGDDEIGRVRDQQGRQLARTGQPGHGLKAGAPPASASAARTFAASSSMMTMCAALLSRASRSGSPNSSVWPRSAGGKLIINYRG